MRVGELRKLLDGVDDGLEIVVRAWDDDSDYCGTIAGAEVQHAHDDDDTPYFAIDCDDESARGPTAADSGGKGGDGV